jgi:hypothetical protein
MLLFIYFFEENNLIIALASYIFQQTISLKYIKGLESVEK